MDWPAIIQEIGGGLPAVVILALAWALWQERKRGDAMQDRLDALQEARLSDVRQHGGDYRETAETATTAINGAITAISTLTDRVIEDRRNA